MGRQPGRRGDVVWCLSGRLGGVRRVHWFAVLAAASLVVARKAGYWPGHATVGLIALWSLIAALVFSGTVLTWLVFADAIALGVAALADLTANEIREESIVHRLEVTRGRGIGQLTPAAA